MPKGGQQSRTRHSLLGGQFNGYDENRARKRETPHLEILQRCERLRREFGVFVKPSDLSSTRLVADDQNTIMSTRRERRSGIGFCSRRVLARSLSSRWRSTVEAHALGNTRALFNALAKKRIDDVTQVRCSSIKTTFRILFVFADHFSAISFFSAAPYHQFDAGPQRNKRGGPQYSKRGLAVHAIASVWRFNGRRGKLRSSSMYCASSSISDCAF